MLIWRLRVSITTFLVVLWDVFKCLQTGFYKNNKITNVQKNKKKVVKKKNEEIKDGCNLCVFSPRESIWGVNTMFMCCAYLCASLKQNIYWRCLLYEQLRHI